MAITVRQATAADKPRILEISSQIWEGDDYWPAVIDDWLADESGQVVVGEKDGVLAGFARISWPAPRYAWMEGIRTDPHLENRGVGRAITEFLLEEARRRGSEFVELSTYVENYASLHIIEAYGFTRVAAFVDVVSDRDNAARSQAKPAEDAVPVPPGEALAFIQGSPFLDIAQGHLPMGWRFYTLARGPEKMISDLAHLLGIRRGSRLTALMGIAPQAHGPEEFSISFLDGDPEDMSILARHALHMGRNCRWIEATVPQWSGRTAPCLEVYRALGYQVWHDGEADVFVYRREIGD